MFNTNFMFNKDKNNVERCNFCGKTKEEVNFLLAGPGIFICDSCIETGYKTVLANKEKEVNNVVTENLKSLPKPHEIKEFLDRFVVGQDEAKKYLSVATYNHYKRIAINENKNKEIQKSNILVIGPTGSGKTYLAETLSKILKVPFVIADATTLTEAGYVGDDVTNILVRLIQNANGDIKQAERGIVYIDEIDKIKRAKDNLSRDVSGEGVQQALLKLIEGNTYEIQVNLPNKQTKVYKINTKNILFILGGAFVGLDNIIKERMDKKVIGFFNSDELHKEEEVYYYTKYVETDDLIQFGLIPELIGRTPIITVLHPLNKEMLRKILIEPENSIIKQFKDMFAEDGYNLEFEEGALDYITQIAYEKNTGARGLRGIIEKILLDIQFEMFKNENKDIVITKDYVIEKLNKNNEKKNVKECKS